SRGARCRRRCRARSNRLFPLRLRPSIRAALRGLRRRLLAARPSSLRVAPPILARRAGDRRARRGNLRLAGQARWGLSGLASSGPRREIACMSMETLMREKREPLDRDVDRGGLRWTLVLSALQIAALVEGRSPLERRACDGAQVRVGRADGGGLGFD